VLEVLRGSCRLARRGARRPAPRYRDRLAVSHWDDSNASCLRPGREVSGDDLLRAEVRPATRSGGCARSIPTTRIPAPGSRLVLRQHRARLIHGSRI